jgi:GNAT superfamily N-acetyltransferase
LVDSFDKFCAAESIGCQVFQNRLPSNEELTRAWSAPRSEEDRRKYASFVAWIDKTPAAAGGLTMADHVVRLWGAATLPELRRRGGYRSLVGARLQEGHSRGANLAIVTARVETSGPILQKMGFRHVGITKQYQLGL